MVKFYQTTGRPDPEKTHLQKPVASFRKLTSSTQRCRWCGIKVKRLIFF